MTSFSSMKSGRSPLFPSSSLTWPTVKASIRTNPSTQKKPCTKLCDYHAMNWWPVLQRDLTWTQSSYSRRNSSAFFVGIIIPFTKDKLVGRVMRFWQEGTTIEKYRTYINHLQKVMSELFSEMAGSVTTDSSLSYISTKKKNSSFCFLESLLL